MLLAHFWCAPGRLLTRPTPGAHLAHSWRAPDPVLVRSCPLLVRSWPKLLVLLLWSFWPVPGRLSCSQHTVCPQNRRHAPKQTSPHAGPTPLGGHPGTPATTPNALLARSWHPPVLSNWLPTPPGAAFRARSEPLLARSWSLMGAPGPFLVLSWPTPGSLLACSWHAFKLFRRGPTALNTLFIYRTAGTLKNTCHPTPAQCLQEDTPAGPLRSPALSKRLPTLVARAPPLALWTAQNLKFERHSAGTLGH